MALLRAEALASEPASLNAEEAIAQDWQIEVPWQGHLDLDRRLPWRLTLSADGHWAPPTRLEPGGDQEAVEMRLFPTGRVTGRALPAQDEPAPEEVTVQLQSTPPSRAESSTIPRSLFACPVAQARWSCEVPRGRLDLRVEVKGFVPHYLWGVEVAAGETTDLGDLRLERGASLVGWVETDVPATEPSPAELELTSQIVGWQGNPLERKRVALRAIHATTNERGFFQIKALPPGGYTLTVSKPEFALEKLPSITVHEGQELVIDSPIVLYPLAELELYLEPPVDSSGLSWTIALTRPEAQSNVYSTIERSAASLAGFWRHGELSRGPYRLEILDSQDSPWFVQQVEVETGMSPLFLDLGGMRIKGTISIGDEPLSTTLVFGSTQKRPHVKLTSDEDGRFEGYLPRGGTWRLDVVDRESSVFTQALEPVEVRKKPGKTFAEVDISLPDTRLSGEVVEDGEPVPGAFVIIARDNGEREKLANLAVDEEGRFELLGLSPGKLQVSARLGDRVSDWLHFDLQSSQEQRELSEPDLRLELKRKIELRGQVVSASGGVAGAMVVATPAGDTSFTWQGKAVTGADGRFSVKLDQKVKMADLLIIPAGFDVVLRRVHVGSDMDVPPIAVAQNGGTLVLADVRLFEYVLHHGEVAVPLSMLMQSLFSSGAMVPRPGEGMALENLAPGMYAMCPGAHFQEDLCAFGEVPPFGELVLVSPATEAGSSVPKG